MPSKKKLQVFVSSTYTDMIEERQAAVEAILRAGHIPAGMELFAAGDKSQWDVIKRWIDESDVYLLILGGRYGSIDLSTGKSYIQLEYEYAIKSNKPYFSVVMSDDYLDKKVKGNSIDFIERDNSNLLKEFKSLVTTKMVSFFSDITQIKYAILDSLLEFSRREDLIGWIPGTQSINTAMIAEEIARLTKENEYLKQNASILSLSAYGLTFEELKNILQNEKFQFPASDVKTINEIKSQLGNKTDTISVLDFFKGLSEDLNNHRAPKYYVVFLERLRFYDLVAFSYYDGTWSITGGGKAFIAKLKFQDRFKVII